MKVKVKNEENVKLKVSYDEFKLIEESLKVLGDIIYQSENCEEFRSFINHNVFDYQEFESCVELRKKIEEMIIKIVKNDNIDPF